MKLRLSPKLSPRRENQKKAIERSYEKRGVPRKTATSRAFATIRSLIKKGK